MATDAEYTGGCLPVNLIDVFWHEGMLKHDTGNGVFSTGMDPGFLDVLEKHPENSDRVRNMVSILKRGPISPYIVWHLGRPALISELLSFHTPGTMFLICPSPSLLNFSSYVPIIFCIIIYGYIAITRMTMEIF